MKLTSFDGGLTWYPQVYDADTTIGLDNTGFLKFDMDIEMGDENVFNTTGSQLWKRIVFLFDAELKEQYSLMRQDRFTVDNIMKYLYGEQISQIPATFYNKDMQSKYLNFGSSYLYALHGSGEQHIKRWIRERIMYCDTLLGYRVSSSDYITLRSSKLGEVYLDIQTYIPMYVSVKWRDEANNTGLQTKRVGRGETVRFTYNMPTATDQEIIVYAGYYLKSLGDVSNLQPTSMLIANASRLTEITCHSPNLMNTDLSECKLLQKIDLSNSTALGTGIGAQPILNIQNCKYLRYCNCYNTKLTAIYTMQSGGNLEEIYYPSSTQVIDLRNQTYLTKVGLPSQASILCESLANVTIQNCPNIEYMSYPFNEDTPIDFNAMKYVQTLDITNSLIPLTSLNFNGFDKMMSIKLASMPNLESLGFDDMLPSGATSTLKNISISNCPKITKASFNVSSNDYKVEFAPTGCDIDLSGLGNIKTIESNASIKNLNVLRIPTSTKELKFTAQYGDGLNEIKSIWSANAIHNNDGFEGIDLIDIQLTYLDMSSLTITNAINFHLAPTTQHPNLNTLRDGTIKPYFRPSGSLDFTNYTGAWKNMFKGLDLDKLVITMPEGYLPDEDISSLFEGCKIGSVIKPHSIISKFNFAKVFDYILKDSDITDISLIELPSYKFSLKGAFMNTPIAKDITLSPYISDVTDCFRGCHNLTSVISNWNRTYSYSPITTNCYYDCINIEKIDNMEGYLRNIPSDWGGHGFNKDVMGTYTVEITEDNFTIVLGDLVDDGVVEWGDNTYTYGKSSHRFAKAGVYAISGKIYPNIENTIPDVTLATTLISVSKLPSSRPNYKNMFNGCQSLRIIDMSTSDSSKVTNTSGMLANCTALTTAPTFDYSSITDASSMFQGCRNILKIAFKNLKNPSAILTGIIEGCLSLTTIGFTGKTDVTSARAIIDILNQYILDNAVSSSALQSEVYSLRNDINNEVDTINEHQEAQDEEILNTMLATTEMYEMMLMTTMSASLNSNTFNISADNEPTTNIFGMKMISIYVTLIKKGLKTIDEIPYIIREQVRLYL